MITTSLHALAASAFLMACAATPSLAASPITEAFLANVTPNVDFLDRSSRFALTNSKDAKIKAFARTEAADQTRAANALYDWTQGSGSISTSAQAEPPMQTGRSAAVTNGAVIADERLPAGQEDLDLIGGLDGQEFDTNFKAKQVVALQQVETDYKDYIAKGDDPILLALASRELPKVRAALARLGKI